MEQPPPLPDTPAHTPADTPGETPARPPPLPREAPPTSPGALTVPRIHEGWSTPLGIVMIVFGALAGLGSLTRIANAFLLGAMPMPSASGSMSTFTTPYQAAQVALGVLLVLAAALGLIAGIGLAVKKPWALRLALIWAPCKLVILVPALVVDVIVQRAMLAAMTSQGGPAMPGFFGPLMSVFTVGFGFLIAGGLPIFVLVFCLRPKAREAWRARFADCCPRCGYSLAGLLAERCPECGHAIATEPPR